MKYLIIAGTEKSGTTSVFQYLGSHPSVSNSIRKETDYFRNNNKVEMSEYLKHFKIKNDTKILVEASPGYLADSEKVTRKIQNTIPEAYLLFILRDPIERLISSFKFHKSRLNISDKLSFESYLQLCFEYEKTNKVFDTSLSEWQLRVPGSGLYAKKLAEYYKYFDENKILIMTHDYLKNNPQKFMTRICDWIDIDSSFYDNYIFNKSNVTFDHKFDYIQKLALNLNKKFEPLFIRFPYTKRQLLKLYKIINKKNTTKKRIDKNTEEVLRKYYEDDLKELAKLVETEDILKLNWLSRTYEQ
ncbi:MAG: sulfotransferase [Candidatus Thiodiazotropha taylori]|nr:sulfotransferase [Candidatus Thiodiazotropha taylori]